MTRRRLCVCLALLSATATNLPSAIPWISASPASGELDDLAQAKTLDEQVAVLYREGRYSEAIPKAEKILAILEKALGPEHPDVSQALNTLTELYRSQGLYTRAEVAGKRALEIREQTYGPDHLAVAQSLNALAFVYRSQDRFTEAEPLYKRSLAVYEKALGPDHPAVATILNNLAAMYMSQGRYSEAELLDKRSLEVREKALGRDHLDVAQSLNNLALLYRITGRYAEAEALYKRSLAIREKVLDPEHPDVAGSLNNLAALYVAEGRYADAEPLYRRSLQITEKTLGGEHPDVATSLNNLALLYRKQNRLAEAEPLYQRSLAVLEKALGADSPTVAQALNNLAELYSAEGHYTEAEALDIRSLEIREKVLGSNHPLVATSLNNLAVLYASQSRNADAEPLYKRGLAIAEQALGPDQPDIAATLDNLAALYDREGRFSEGLVADRRAVAILSRWIGKSAPDRSDAADSGRRANRSYFLRDIKLIQEANEPDAVPESFRVMQLARNSSVAEIVSKMAARFAAGSDDFAAIVRERQDAAIRWSQLDQAIVKDASKPTNQRDSAAEAELRAAFSEVGAKLDTLDTRIAHDFPGYAELSNAKPLELADAEALLAADEAMLIYLIGETESWLWVLRHDRANVYKLDIGGTELTAEVTKLRQRLDPELNPDLLPFDVKRANALYDKVIGPAREVLDGAHQVFVVPDGALESLPPAVLVTASPAVDPDNASDYRGVAWFARKYATTELPSVSTLRALRMIARQARASAPFVGIGAPTLEGASGGTRGIGAGNLFRGSDAEVDAVKRLPPLPETASELRAIAKIMGASDDDLYLGERASAPLLHAANLDRYRVIEFATHGLLSGDLPGLAEPALVLTPPPTATPENDGLLTSSEIATLKLDADWVVLSACNTAAADGTPDAAGLSGLAKAFFYAGARSLLVSNWSVPSNGTVKLMTGLFSEWEKNPAIGRSEALRRAEMAMLDPASPSEFAHPMFWGPFVLAGEGAPGR
jgi:CHAT domain-containing protein/Tfp pilus assembly protein PilF